MIKLFATDIDHTMYCNELGYIPQEDYEAVEKLISKGVIVCLASSRMYSGVQKEIERLKLIENNGYITVNNGAYTLRLNDNKVLTDIHFTKEQLDHIFQISREMNLGYSITQNKYIITEAYSEIFDYDHKAVGCDIMVTDDVFKYVYENVYQLSFFNDELNMYEICEQLKEKYGDIYNFNVPQRTCTDVSVKGVNKFMGVEAVAKDLGISMDEVACIGDNDNDIPMLEKARLSACVANGSENAKKAAKVVVKSDGEAGVAQFINEYILKELEND